MEKYAEVRNPTTQSATYRRQPDNDRFSPTASNHRLVIITQLLQLAEHMRHIDELFLWLSHILIQRLDIQIIQFWANQPQSPNPSDPELRATVCQSLSLPRHVVINPQVTEITKRIHNERRGAMPQAVASLFPPTQTHLLTRYNLNYWASYFMYSKRSLPSPGENDLDIGTIPFTISVSLFLRQAPSPYLLPNVEHILEHAMLIAKNRGLLCHEVKPICPINRPKSKAPALKDLISQRIEDINAIPRCNLLSSTMIMIGKCKRSKIIH